MLVQGGQHLAWFQRSLSETTDMSDDAQKLLGTTEKRGDPCLCPALQNWPGEELSRFALGHKEWRKAREERAIAAKEV